MPAAKNCTSRTMLALVLLLSSAAKPPKLVGTSPLSSDSQIEVYPWPTNIDPWANTLDAEMLTSPVILFYTATKNKEDA